VTTLFPVTGDQWIAVAGIVTGPAGKRRWPRRVARESRRDRSLLSGVGIDLADILTLVVSVLALGIAGRAERRAARVERASRRASLVVVPHGSSVPDGETFPRTFKFSIRNVAQTPAENVQLWLTDRDGRKVSTDMVKPVGLALTERDEPARGTVTLTEPVEIADLVVRVAWTDATGPHEEPSTTQPT
jgi:hypothetical protein